MRICIALLLWAAGLAFAAAVSPDEPLQPIPLTPPAEPRKAALGQRLFTETRLSANNRVSCASCHRLAAGGADTLKFSVGLGGRLGATNTPTVFNSAFNFRQGWTGERRTIEEQVEKVMVSPTEFGSDWKAVAAKLGADGSLRSAFADVYRDGITRANVVDALAAFTRSLTTPNSRFDRYLRGDMAAITPVERAGYANFKKFGCTACHQGVNVGGNMYQHFGVLGDPYASRKDGAPREPGPLYKVPGLRNVALTAPYFHDGSAATLGDAVDVMLRVQVGRTATAQERDSIVKFLGTLTGEGPTP